MSARASTTAIGAFVVGAIVLIVGAMAFFGSDLLGGKSDKYAAAVIFTGSVKGLDVGAPVTLRGVKVGEVTDIHVSFDAKNLEFVIPVTVSVSRGDLGLGLGAAADAGLQTLIDRGLRAQLKTQSLLTGLLYVDFDFIPASTPRYVDFATAQPQIPTAPTELEAILQRVSQIDLQAFMQNADQTLRSLSTFLANPETQRIPESINATLTEVRGLVVSVDAQVDAVGARLDQLAGNADGAVTGLREQVHETGARLDTSLDALDQALLSVRNTSDEMGYAMSEQSPVLHELTRTAAELSRAGRAMQALADSLERQPESLLRGRDDRRAK